MQRRTQPRKIIIPEKLGNGGCDVWPYILGLICNALLHISLFIFYGLFLHNFLYLSVSFIFFIYPFSYVTDILWSLRPSVCSVLAGQTLINRKYYMNTVQKISIMGNCCRSRSVFPYIQRRMRSSLRPFAAA